MSGPNVGIPQNGIYQQPHLGLGEDSSPVLPQCAIDGCTYFGISSQSAQDHMVEAHHNSCKVVGCEGRYSASQEEIHMWKYHQIRPAARDKGPFNCQFVGCEWSTTDGTKQAKHEGELHTQCDTVDCDFRGTLGLYLIHANTDHDGDEPKRSSDDLE